MIVGVIVRNYKIYEGIKFIPVSFGENFCAYFGLNGVGKSSVLEALDTFFNGSLDKTWNRTKGAATGYTNTSYVVPVFLIKKSDFLTGKKENQDFLLLEKISNYFWDTQTFKSTNTEITNSFVSFRDALKNRFSSEEYFFVAIGIREGYYATPYFGTFQTDEDFLKIFDIEKKQYENQNESNKQIDKDVEAFFKEHKTFLSSIKKLYHYVYIPSDIDIKSYTKLQTENMQKLMHRDVTKEIEKAIGTGNLETINTSLEKFLSGISNELKNYTYKRNSERQEKITMNDMTEKILESYFSKKVLTKSDSNVPIDTMSSGEKHKALIDICYAFLGEDKEHDRKIILAIDEPENSLHVSACYDQFEKLKTVSLKNHQVLITTHWYGFLPIAGEGIAHNIYENENKREIASYHLGNYQEEIILNKKYGNHKLPDDIFLKSKYDLVQSIISSIRPTEAYNYILVEGSSDKIYLEHYLHNCISEKRLRIMPLGGCGEIAQIMKILNASLLDKKSEINGKVLALIDTDTNRQEIEWKDNDNFIFKRLLYIENKHDISLVNISDSRVSPETEIEDTLDPKLFLDTLEEFVGNDEEFSFIKNRNETAKCSFDSIDYKRSESKKIKDFFAIKDRKVEFAKKYVYNSKKDNTIPTIIKELCKEFSWDIDIIKKDFEETTEIAASSVQEKKKKVVVVKKRKSAN